ncbi:uncharacterized protein ACA1_374310 [Acanthamoeba castellanii str. Neff]|uniref:Uncharacterized protein n=1 Tax=Acanthamoeba castellanii (strain ATCC 30010 / Neff) TaxID=1257118 RepID=L8GHX5_ACACF|nr:uncharacterized protein ACA1_374310 [Acanthamoeba castellanii str. Neff]ELR12363.1 hypothetical protein ACA1_374310 [Acanthamoeba castellanii str. Neff]
MRVKTVIRGKRTAGTVYYCTNCANDLVAGGEIDIYPAHRSQTPATRGGVTVSLNKRGRWDLLKNLKTIKTQKKGCPRDKVPQYHDMAKGSCQCSGYYPGPKPRDNRPAFLHKIRPSVVVLSRDEVMEVLPESDWAHLADARGVVAEQWLCFFTKQGHCAEGHSEVAAWQYFNGMSQEDQQSYGLLLVKQDNAEKKGKLFQCPFHSTMSARNKLRPKARGKDKGTTKERTRNMAASS